jgi:hypothetical protein
MPTILIVAFRRATVRITLDLACRGNVALVLADSDAKVLTGARSDDSDHFATMDTTGPACDEKRSIANPNNPAVRNEVATSLWIAP